MFAPPPPASTAPTPAAPLASTAAGSAGGDGGGSARCNIYLECTTGIGDLLIDAISGATLALARGCGVAGSAVPRTPRVHTKWERPDRHYDWPSLVASSHFEMARPMARPEHRGPWRGWSLRSTSSLVACLSAPRV